MKQGTTLMKRPILGLFLISAIVIASNVGFAATPHRDTWNTSGPLAWANSIGGNPSMTVVTTGGNPGGYLYTGLDIIALGGASTGKPQLSGDYGFAQTVTISVDLKFFAAWPATQAFLRFRYLNGSYNGWRYLLTSGPTTGVWNTYTVNINPFWTDAEAQTAGWAKDFNDATVVSFAQTMSAVYAPEIRFEGGVFTAGIDNFTLGQLIFSADFESDTPGSPPNSNPPTYPPGDSITVSDVVTDCSTIAVQATGSGGFGSQALMISRGSSCPPSNPEPTFSGSPDTTWGPYNNGLLTIMWRASCQGTDLGGGNFQPLSQWGASSVVDPSNYQPYLVGYSYSGSDPYIGDIVYRDATTEPGLDPLPTEVNWSVNTPQAFRAVVKMATKTFDLYIDESLVAPDRSFQHNFTGLQDFYFRIFGANAAETYHIDDIYIIYSGSATSCPTPEAPESLDLSPANEAAEVSTSQTLTWANWINTDSYDVYLGATENPIFVGNVTQQGESTQTSYSPLGLNPNATYYWKIVAKNTCGGSSEGPVWIFTTEAFAPLPPKLYDPGKGDTGVPLSPKLQWQKSNGANRYHLEVSTDPNFITNIIVDQDVIPNPPNTNPVTYTVTGPLPIETVYYWRVNATNGSGTSAYSEVWNFKTQPNYVPPFASLKGISDPPGDSDGDGIDDTFETNYLHSSTSMKTLFVRPKQEVGLGQYQPWAGFIALFPAKNPDGSPRPGFADIPAFINAGIEIMVIGDPNNPYYDPNTQTYPMRDFGYDPSKDPNHPNCDILEIIYGTSYLPGSTYKGHTFFSATGRAWSWDTKGYTPSTPGIHGYKMPQIYPVPLDSYFNEGAYSNITGGESPSTTACSTSSPCLGASPLNVNGSKPTSGRPDTTVEFNVIAFDSGGQISSITLPLPSTGYDKDTVLRRTIVHEMGHALLNGLNTDHCTDHPECIMNDSTVDWVMHDFGPGTCEHRPSGSKDIRAMIHNNAHYGAAPQAPTLSSPANGATNQTSSPTLRWNAVSGATYRLQVSTDGFASFVVDNSVATTSQQVTGLSTGTYSWRVNATGTGGTSAWSTVWSFTVGPAPPSLSSPANGSATQTTTPTLSWSTSTGATSYLLEISTDSGFNSKVYTNSASTTSRAVPSGKLSNNTTYYWHVNATGANGTSKWSSVWSFITIPGVPTLTAPANNTSTAISIPVNFTWTAPSGGAVSYSLQFVSTTSGTTAPNWSNARTLTGITATSKSLGTADGLSYNKYYAWRVIAVNAGGGSATSSYRRFRTIQQIP